MKKDSTQVRRKVRLGLIHADDVTFSGAIDVLAARVAAAQGGYVVTPNVDHVCLAQTHPEFRDAYRDAALSLVDGMPLLWLARLIGQPLPEKISGSDLLRPLMARAAQEGWRVYFLGGVAGIGAQAADKLRAEFPALQIVGVDSPPLGFEQDPRQNATVLAKIAAARAQLVLVALGCPKQELWMHRNAAALGSAIALGIGATLDFVAGKVRRAPPWMSRIGLEWLYRLVQEPRRMATRYLVRDRAIFGIAVRMLMSPRSTRSFLA